VIFKPRIASWDNDYFFKLFRYFGNYLQVTLMDWIKGATNNCNFLNIFTDRFEVLSKEVMLKGQRQIGRKILVLQEAL